MFGASEVAGLDAPRILIVRLSAIGDVVFASPLIRATRARYPNAYIAWLAEPGPASLVRHHPELDAVILWPKTAWQTLWRKKRYKTLWQAIRAFRAELREHRFTVVFDVQGLLKSACLGWLSGAPERIGFKSKEGNQWLLTRALEKRADTQRIASEYLGFAEDIGLVTDSFAMEVALSEGDEALLDRERARGPYAVLCPFTTRPQKHWTAAHWRQFIGLVSDNLGLRIVVLGGPDDRTEVIKLLAGMDHTSVESQVGELSLSASAAIIAGAALVVGVDTGLTHMGIAFKRPTVALFGSTVPYTDTTLPQAEVIFHDLECAPCRRRPTCNGRFDCMTDISAGEVLAASRRVLQIADPVIPIVNGV